jgi:uncharacterized protein (DUF2267 family)
MTIPSEYQRASLDFERFMIDARDLAGLATTNMAWNMVVGVLQTFRRRLPVRDALRFASVLPPVLRAIFVADWNMDEPPVPFGDRAAMTREVQALRAAHNFSPDTAIHAVAGALRRHVDAAALDGVLATLPAAARDYWAV